MAERSNDAVWQKKKKKREMLAKGKTYFLAMVHLISFWDGFLENGCKYKRGDAYLWRESRDT